MYEIEVKALVADIENLHKIISEKYPQAIAVRSRQLNHYFNADDQAIVNFLAGTLFSVCRNNDKVIPDDIYTGTKLAVRTRWDSLKGTLLVVKYSVDDSCSQNGVVRRELELPCQTTQDSLNNSLLDDGFSYQSKWSRDRTEYRIGEGRSICVDLNSGYRGVCEVEKIIYSLVERGAALTECRSILTELGLQELDSNLLDRMFQFYSANWRDFYGTNESIFDSVSFTI